MGRKVDNGDLAAKLDLRRALLREIGEPLDVLDAFAGEDEVLWSRLRREFEVANYVALDLKSRKGRLKMDSRRYLEGVPWKHNVIDLDAYGDPFDHYQAVIARGRPVTVFLTAGNTNHQQATGAAMERAGITFPVPAGLRVKLRPWLTERELGRVAGSGLRVARAVEALNSGKTKARYFGVVLESSTG